jgi:hypothetical protein
MMLIEYQPPVMVVLRSYVRQNDGRGLRLCPRPPQYVSIGLWCM